MKKILPVLLLPMLLCAGGCAELSQTVRIMNQAFVELFRLPIYCLRLPFQLLQGLGPVIQSAVRSAANVAPLLLFIENRTGEPRLDPARPGELEESVRLALSSPCAEPLLSVLEEETASGPPARFLVVDVRIAADPRAARALAGAFPAGGGRVRCVRVDGRGIFAEPGRFLSLCGRMRGRGDVLFSAASFNGALGELTGNRPGHVPPDPADRALARRLERALGGPGAEPPCGG